MPNTNQNSITLNRLHREFACSEKLIKDDLLRNFLPPTKEQPEENKLTDDEEQLLAAYRRFKARSMPGKVFRWKTPIDKEIVYPQEPSLIIHPNEA